MIQNIFCFLPTLTAIHSGKIENYKKSEQITFATSTTFVEQDLGFGIN